MVKAVFLVGLAALLSVCAAVQLPVGSRQPLRVRSARLVNDEGTPAAAVQRFLEQPGKLRTAAQKPNHYYMGKPGQQASKNDRLHPKKKDNNTSKKGKGDKTGTSKVDKRAAGPGAAAAHKNTRSKGLLGKKKVADKQSGGKAGKADAKRKVPKTRTNVKRTPKQDTPAKITAHRMEAAKNMPAHRMKPIEDDGAAMPSNVATAGGEGVADTDADADADAADAGPVTVLDNFNSVEDDGEPTQPANQRNLEQDQEEISELRDAISTARTQVGELKKELADVQPALPLRHHKRIRLETEPTPQQRPLPKESKVQPKREPAQKAPQRREQQRPRLSPTKRRKKPQHKTVPIEPRQDQPEQEKEKKRPVPLKEHPTKNNEKKKQEPKASKFSLKRADEFVIDAAHSLALSYVDGDAGQTIRAVRESQAAAASAGDAVKELQLQDGLAKDEVDKREVVVAAQDAEEIKEMAAYQLKNLADLQPGSRLTVGSGKVIRVDVARFEAIVKDAQKPALLVIAPLYGCGFCKMMHSKIAKAAEQVPQVAVLHMVSDLHGVLEVEQQIKPPASGVYPHIWGFRNGKVTGCWNEDKEEKLLEFAQNLL